MTLQLILDAFGRAPSAADLRERLPGRGALLRLGGLPGSSGAVLAAWLAAVEAQRLLVIVAPSPGDAERWLTDLGHLTDLPIALYPQREALGEDEPHYEIAGERAETIEAILGGRLRIVVTTARATAERTLVPAALEALRLRLAVGERRPPAEVVRELEAMGYRRVPTVSEVAEFSVRGGILDVYGFGMAGPARLEWWGDDVSSIRGFDLTSQRSTDEMTGVTVLPIDTKAVRDGGDGRGGQGSRGKEKRSTLLELLPPDALLIEEATGPDADEVARAWNEAAHHLDVARRLGEDVPPRDAIFEEPDAWRRRIAAFPRLSIRDEPADLQMGFFPPERVDRNLNRLRALLGGPPATLILCDNEGQLERMEELLDDGGRRPANATLAVGALEGGFVLPSLRVLTDHEIFRRARRLRRTRRYRQAAPSAATGALTIGDYVVHLDHGIGIYRGIDTVRVGESTFEVAVVEYEGGDRLNVPLYRLDQLERYRAAGEDGDRPPPKLHRLGGSTWQRVRDRTRTAIRQMAADLLDLYARRSVTGGYPFPPDSRWQRELESAFLYEDTPDQRTATEDIKRDMEQPRPMDRLLVGDVGYGKTEVAVRAAFKAVQGGKQVAVLVPTTILAEQHGRTFTERLADYPVKIEVLSRFRTAKEQKQALTRLASGETDIVIGTHRLLSKDVAFKDLGLLVVDEEHRFGVKHKERLKELRLQVDVLTLTATPIPRTLHLSLAGLRDLTLIETPPRDRSAVLTFVEPWDDALLEEAFARELDRGGQAFMVHNRIETIETIAARVRALAPRARVAVAHGQMAADDLEQVMRGFVSGEVDILVTTMIVESGLDVPNANTMVVHDAHRLGLAQLYQLRGRVGRSHRRAYCYLLVPDTIDADAEDRLKVLEHHTELGAGYRIALKDLELRGAGNLLGSEQSGHAHAVGFDLYLRWLEETVKALRGQGGQDQPLPPDVVLDRPSHLPDGYVADDDVKLDLYRRLARAVSSGEIDQLREEIRERFGPLPPEAETLLDMARLRVVGAALGLQHVLVRGDEARLTFRAGAAPRMAGLTAALDDVQLAADVRRTVPLSLRLTRLGGEAMIPALVRALRAVAT
ncbi:MAG TPA: transcription-repair coupling factor [Gemmatimonadales bacterium]|jgi:transcription-repair coupling factor (superfamily II helicase)|nr:transcription-repair coupling factor [Gemmatimonadales bacterium]